LELAYATKNQKKVFDLKYAGKQTQSIRDSRIQERLLEFLATKPDESAWRSFCGEFRLNRKGGGKGPRVEYVSVTVGDPKEYKDVSKDGTGAYRKALKGHKWQVVYLDREAKPKIRPVYAFESTEDVRRELSAVGGQVYGFFRSGCLVSIDKPIDHPTTPLAPGVYRLNTIKSVGQAKVTSATGQESLPISITKFIEANLKPVHALNVVAALRDRKTDMDKKPTKPRTR
jgi:hypothetical protein